MSVLLSGQPVISEEVCFKHSPRRLLPVCQSVSGGWGAPSEFSQPPVSLGFHLTLASLRAPETCTVFPGEAEVFGGWSPYVVI